MVNPKQIPFNPPIGLLTAIFIIFSRDTDTGYLPYTQLKNSLQSYAEISPKIAAKCIKYAVSRGWLRAHNQFLYGSFEIDGDIKAIPLQANQIDHITTLESCINLSKNNTNEKKNAPL